MKNMVKEYDAARMEKNNGYRRLAEKKNLGARGRLSEVYSVTRELAWRDTSTLTKEVPWRDPAKIPYELYGRHLVQAPIIANKRYTEWRTGKPRGPSDEYLKDKAQRAQDTELWENIKFARLEKTRVELREEGKAMDRARRERVLKEKEEAKAKSKGSQSVDEKAMAIQLEKMTHIANNDFELLRKIPSERLARLNMKGWNVGHQVCCVLSGDVRTEGGACAARPCSLFWVA
jgi:hypothetical protein